MTAHLSVLDDSGVETLGVLDVDGLDVGVELLLGALLVVTLAGDANAETEGNALDAGFPDLLVKLGVEADVLGALNRQKPLAHELRRETCIRQRQRGTHHSGLSELADLLDGARSALLEAHTMNLIVFQHESVFRPDTT